jgi:hypothetical protein
MADLLMSLDPVLYNGFRLANSSRKNMEHMLTLALKVTALKTVNLPSQDLSIIRQAMQMEYCRVNRLDPARPACLAAMERQTTQSNAATRYSTGPATTSGPEPVNPGLPVKSKKALKQAMAKSSRQ